MLHEQSQRFVGQAQAPQSRLFRDTCKQMTAQCWNIADALAQGGNRQLLDIEPIIEIFAETARFDLLLQALVCGGNNTHVHMHWTARADGLGATVSAPSRGIWTRAWLVAAGFGLAPWLAGAGLIEIAVAIFAAFVVAALITNLAKKQIGGYTGDVLGAAQQLAEIAILAVLSAG